jgi:hypothetical protein
MEYGDFSGLVQLGIGLHLGAALLQLYGEIGFQPLVRVIDRIDSIISGDEGHNNKDLISEKEELKSEFDIFKIQLFNEYRHYMYVNTVVAGILLILVIYMSYMPDETLDYVFSIFIVAFSVLPALCTIFAIWVDVSKAVKPLKKRADKLEQKVLKTSS